MYPLKVQLAEGVGFALANTEDEHRALSDAGYVPAFVVSLDAAFDRAAAKLADAIDKDVFAAAVRKPGRPKKVSDAGA